MTDYTGPGELVNADGSTVAVQLNLRATADGWGGTITAVDGLPSLVQMAFNRRVPLTVRVAAVEATVRIGYISRSGRAEVTGEGAWPW